MRRIRGRVAVGAAFATAVLGAGGAWAATTITSPVADGKIYACYSTDKGTLRLVNQGGGVRPR